MSDGTTRDIYCGNTYFISVAKEHGLGEKRESKWFFSAEEFDQLPALYEERKAKTKKAKADEAKKYEALAKANKALEAETERQTAFYRAEVNKVWRDFVQLYRAEAEAFASASKKHERAKTSARDLTERKYGTACIHDWVDDKDTFKAISFARSMIREGKPPGLAIAIAARYYKVAATDVAKHVGQVAARVKRGF